MPGSNPIQNCQVSSFNPTLIPVDDKGLKMLMDAYPSQQEQSVFSLYLRIKNRVHSVIENIGNDRHIDHKLCRSDIRYF